MAFKSRIFHITPDQWTVLPLDFASLTKQQVSAHRALVKTDNPFHSKNCDTPLVHTLTQSTFADFNIPDYLSFSEGDLFACDYIFNYLDSVTNHATEKRQPLRLLLYSPNVIRGVGVIGEIIEGFHRRGIRDTLLTISSSKFRALLIRGLTIAEATKYQLNNCDTPRTINDETMKSLRKMWRGVRYVILDDFTGWTKRVLARFSILLSIVNDIDLPFGGLNVILTGNFYQTHSIALRRSLYQSNPQGPYSLSDLGKCLYAEFSDVVILNNRLYTDDMLQTFWSAVEKGDAHDIGIRARNIRLFRHYVEIDFHSYGWETAPLITCNLPLIKSWNIIALRQYASIKNQRVFHYKARDTIHGETLIH